MAITSKAFFLKDGHKIHGEIQHQGKKVWLIAVHGVAEHLGRHQYLVDLFADTFNIFRFDLRGHGRSSGERAYVDNFETYLSDLRQLIEELQNNWQMEKYVIFGHSMGATIVAGLLQTLQVPQIFPLAAFLSAPTIAIPGPKGMFKLMPRQMIAALAQMPFSWKLKNPIDLKKLSHRPQVYQEYLADEYTSKDLHSRLIWQLLLASQGIFARPLNLKYPLYCAVGGDDQIISPYGVSDYFRLIEKKGQLKLFSGGYHELHNEVDHLRQAYLHYLKNSLTEVLYFQ